MAGGPCFEEDNMRRTNAVVSEDGATLREVKRAAWSPAQIVAVVAGLLFVVLGGVGLARTGTDFSNLAASHAQVAGMWVSPLSAIAELVVGVLILAGGAYPAGAKGTMSVFGVILLAFGIIVAIDPTPFYREWAYTKTDGVFYAILGAVLLATAVVSPVFFSRRRVVTQSQIQSDQGAATHVS
jgi:hypothetical protein